MERIICISCGLPIPKSAKYDAYMCRTCEDHIKNGIEMKRFGYLDV